MSEQMSPVCGMPINNRNDWLLLVLRDLIDFFVSYVITVVFISYSLCSIKTQDAIIPKLKLIIPLSCTLFNLPISFFIFFRDYEIGHFVFDKLKTSSSLPPPSSYLIEFFFTLSLLLYQSQIILVVLAHVFLFKHYRNVFNCVCCCKCFSCTCVEFNHGNEGSSSSGGRRRRRRNSPNDILSLDELRKLDLRSASY